MFAQDTPLLDRPPPQKISGGIFSGYFLKRYRGFATKFGLVSRFSPFKNLFRGMNSRYLFSKYPESPPIHSKTTIKVGQTSMKPKEYAKQFRDRLSAGEPKDAIISDIHCQFISEVWALINSKKVANDLKLIGVLKSQDDKWRSLSRLVSEIPQNGFVFGIFAVIPEIYNAAEVRGFLDILSKQKSNL